MAAVIDFASGRRVGPVSERQALNPDLMAKLEENRAVMLTLIADALAQQEQRRLPSPSDAPIWRPERPWTGAVRHRLWSEWVAGQEHVEAADHLLQAVYALSRGARETKGDSSALDKLAELVRAVLKREVWRQFHIAPRDREGLAWKRKRLGWLRDQTAGELILAADQAWLGESKPQRRSKSVES